LRQIAVARIEREQAALDALLSRPSMADPLTMVAAREEQIHALRQRARRCLGHALDRAEDDLQHRLARVQALSPAATLQRGYAVVQRADGHVVRRPGDVQAGDEVTVRLAEGQLGATVTRV
jgi:exodeoxyribonuclease VII large subunit